MSGNSKRSCKLQMHSSHDKFPSNIFFYDNAPAFGKFMLRHVTVQPGLSGACFLMLIILVNKTKIIG